MLLLTRPNVRKNRHCFQKTSARDNSQRVPRVFALVSAFILGVALSFGSACSPTPVDPSSSSAQNSFSSLKSSTFSSFHRTSQYLTMRDGVKIAVDLYLPDNLKLGQKLPAMLHQTRYWRAIEYRWLIALFKDDRPRGTIGQYAQRFLEHGYAWVDVDVRGSGASFGTRPVAYSPAEVQDGAEIVDWIIRQPWSNGKVGAMGISYSGGTAEMLLVNQHPAVKAVAPMFSGFDLYSEIAFPGGIHLSWFTKTWTAINNHLDNNTLPFAGWMADLFVQGVRPVDSDSELLDRAVKEHEGNWSPFREASGMTFRDDPPPSRQASTIDALSTKTYADHIGQSGAAIYSYSGWFDGGYALAAIQRYRQHNNPKHRLILGPWDHGGRRRISPYSLGPAQFDHIAELLMFFDRHFLKTLPQGEFEQHPIKYYTMGAERWNTATHWPPPATPTTFYLAANQHLSQEPPPHQSPPDQYPVDPKTGTGPHTRWNTLVGIPLERPYPDRKTRDEDLVVYTSDPLQQAIEVTGHPVITIYLSSTAPDTTVFVYLEDVTPQGEVHYVTEGQLRALHRKLAQPNVDCKEGSNPCPLPQHSFTRSDAALLKPGEIVSLTISLLPTSYEFQQGHRIRIALAGADVDHFQLLENPSPTWKIWHTATQPSHINLPVISHSSH